MRTWPSGVDACNVRPHRERCICEPPMLCPNGPGDFRCMAHGLNLGNRVGLKAHRPTSYRKTGLVGVLQAPLQLSSAFLPLADLPEDWEAEAYCDDSWREREAAHYVRDIVSMLGSIFRFWKSVRPLHSPA